MENKRLTYKLNEQEQEEHKTKYLKFEYFPIPDYCIEKGNYGRISSDMIYNKLGQLEDIEEELGCPLDLVLVPYSLSGLKKIWYHKQWCDVVRVVAYEEATRPYMEVRCKDYKYLKTIFLDDYKNTWWLKEDRSE